MGLYIYGRTELVCLCGVARRRDHAIVVIVCVTVTAWVLGHTDCGSCGGRCDHVRNGYCVF